MPGGLAVLGGEPSQVGSDVREDVLPVEAGTRFVGVPELVKLKPGPHEMLSAIELYQVLDGKGILIVTE